MDQSSGGRPPPPPRKELQGPRPAPLKVKKDSHKIRKPPVPPPEAHRHQQPPYRPPVIIYAVSPKIIHTNPSDFMTLVQRLTGPGNSASSHPPPSPAARFAAIEKAKTPLQGNNNFNDRGVVQGGVVDASGYGDLSGTRFGSILSPGPAGLIRPVPPALFSDPVSPLVSLYHQHQYGGGNSYNNIFPSPSTASFLSPNPMLSPASIEFLSRLLDQ